MPTAALILALVLASHSPVQIAPAFDFRSADDDALIVILRGLAVQGWNLPNEAEVGAFIVRNADGELSCLLWPRTYERRLARYTGEMPPGVVAIAHTHPNHFAHPSRNDVAVARRLKLPSYVVSRSDLYVIDPSSGDSIALLSNDSWRRWRPSKNGPMTH